MADDLGKLLRAAAEGWQSSVHRSLEPGSAAAELGAGVLLLEALSAGDLPQSALTQQTGSSKQAVQQALDQLERAGLVRRDPDPADKRAKRVSLTAAGAAALRARHEAEAEISARLREQLGKKRFKALRKTLRTLG